MFPIRLAFSSRFLRPAPAGEKLLFSAGHHIQLAPVALHPDAGRCLAGLDLLLTCSRMPYVSQPCGNPFVAKSDFPHWDLPSSLSSPLVWEGVWARVQRPVSVRFSRVGGTDVGPPTLPFGQPSSQGPRSGRAWRPGVVRLVGVCGSLWARTSPVYIPLLLSLEGEVSVLASPAAIWAPGASEIGASTRIARGALPATLTACSWEIITFTSIRPRL